MKSRRLGITAALAAGAVLALLLSAYASGSGTVGSGKASATKSVCGLGNGKKAKGAPIKLGGIFTLVPGVDFTTIGKVAKAYFDCVNDNGGINGRPISYKLYTEQLKPDQDAALARKLATSDKVVGVVGSTSLIECAVNKNYWKQKGYYVVIAGVPGECFGSPNYSAVNMGPRYSDIGAAQALVRHGAKSIVIDSPNTIAAYANGGALLVAKAAGLPSKSFGENLPITDPNSIVQKLVQAAGPNGGVILDFTPESATPLMQAAIQQGVVDRVTWASSTPVADDALAKQFGAFDNGRILINSEFTLLDSTGPDMTLMRQVMKKYTPSIPVQSFAQMGFLVGKVVTDALLSIKGPVTKASYNAAVLKLRNIKSDIWCKPWYFWKLPYHIPNNTDITAGYKAGHVVQIDGCIPIQAVDPQLVQIRKWEKQYKLNTG